MKVSMARANVSNIFSLTVQSLYISFLYIDELPFMIHSGWLLNDKNTTMSPSPAFLYKNLKQVLSLKKLTQGHAVEIFSFIATVNLSFGRR